MKKKRLDIKNLDDLIHELDAARSESEKLHLLHYLKALKSEDDTLSGALLFLADSNWDLDELQHRFKTLQHDYQRISFRSKRGFPLQKIAKYAAILILPLGALLFYNQVIKNSSIDRHYISDPGLPNLMDSSKGRDWYDMMAFYKNGDYKSALDQLNTMDLSENNDTLLYFKGIIYYELEDFKTSQEYYRKLEHLKSSVFYFDMEFRLAFALFKSGETEAAKQLFISIGSNQGHPYKKESNAIISDISSLQNQ